MGRTYESLSPELTEWIGRQRMFFVATAALSGTVNVSPKGYDSLRVIDGRTVAYLDLTGSGAETTAHLRENGRITVMWCAFEGPPRIVRVHGYGEVLPTDDRRFQNQFPETPGARSIISITVDRISDSCGYAVPLMAFESERSRLMEWAEGKSDEELREYRIVKNSTSIDGLPALEQ